MTVAKRPSFLNCYVSSKNDPSSTCPDRIIPQMELFRQPVKVFDMTVITAANRNVTVLICGDMLISAPNAFSFFQVKAPAVDFVVIVLFNSIAVIKLKQLFAFFISPSLPYIIASSSSIR